jgi:AraC family transcriptional regulator, transcriptional activator of pobA
LEQISLINNLQKLTHTINRFSDINQLFESTGFEKRTDIPEFFIFTFDELPKEKILKMPPYQKDFYQISLIVKAANAQIDINEQHNNALENTLYFLSPDHVFSWQRNTLTTGFIVFFKPSFVHFFNSNAGFDFPFFDLSENNILHLSPEKASALVQDFEKLYQEYYTPNPYRPQILQALLMSVLFKCKSLHDVVSSTHVKVSKQQEMVSKFKNLVKNCFITHKQVGDYAEKLFISINTLNRYMKEQTGKTAKELIDETLVFEAKKRLQYSTDDVAEIAYAIGFDEPTHFIRFFKNQTTTTPKEYRNAKM